jgi:hypothetical protein
MLPEAWRLATCFIIGRIIVARPSLVRPGADGELSCEETCIAPLWLRAVLGDHLMQDFTWRVIPVYVMSLQTANPDAFAEELRSYPCLSTFETSDRFLFPALKAVPQLRELKVDNTPRLDHEDVRELAQLKQLRRLSIDANVTMNDQIIPQLKAAMPCCEIVVSDGERYLRYSLILSECVRFRLAISLESKGWGRKIKTHSRRNGSRAPVIRARSWRRHQSSKCSL